MPRRVTSSDGGGRLDILLSLRIGGGACPAGGVGDFTTCLLLGACTLHCFLIRTGADLGGGPRGPGPPPPHGHTHSIMHAHTYCWHSMQVSCYTNCYTDSPAECSVNLASLSV